MTLSMTPRILLISLCALFAFSGCKKAADGSADKSSAAKGNGEFKTEIEKVSYILGYSTGKSLGEQSVDVSTDIFMRGMKDGLAKLDKSPVFTDEQMRETMQTFRTSLMEKRRKEREEAGVKNQAEGDKFMAENKTKDKVVTLPSGLQYKIITPGTGEIPKPEDTVMVEYKGTLLNGKVFDSTEERGQPASFPVNSTIPGMSEALKLMPVGSKWEIYIPASLGYGAQGAGAMIGPNQTLIFNLHLVSIKKPEPGADKAAPAAKPAPKVMKPMKPMVAPKSN